MPHDKNGVKINPGDVVRVPAEGQWRPHETVARVLSVQEGSESCNVTAEGVVKSAYEHCPSLPKIETMTLTADKVEKIG